MKRLWFILGLVLVTVLSATSVVFVDETEWAFVTRFGRLTTDEPLSAGLHVKLPWPIDRVRRFDRRLQIDEPPALERITRDKKSLTVASYVCWRIVDAGTFLRTAGTIPDARRRLEERLSAELSAAIGKQELGELVSTQPGASEIEPMMDELSATLRQSARKEFGIEIVDVRLKRFNHPAEVRQAIYERIRSERARDAVRYRSEGESEGQKIRSRADLERDTILAKAEAQATLMRGKADAERTRVLNQAQEKDPAFYELLRTLEAYRRILDEKTMLVLSTDNSIFGLLTRTDPSGPRAASPGGTTAGANEAGVQRDAAVPAGIGGP